MQPQSLRDHMQIFYDQPGTTLGEAVTQWGVSVNAIKWARAHEWLERRSPNWWDGFSLTSQGLSDLGFADQADSGDSGGDS